MKQILSLALALLPYLAWAQYPSNGNQKITLGEQTTADGLIYRGVLNDTGLITPLSDTSAYIILDTVNNKFYNYNRTTNVWSVAGGGTAVTSITGGTGLTGGTITSTGTLAADTNFLVTRFDTSSMLTNYYRAGRNTIIQASDVPTLNQNTTGSAATLTTSRTFQTNLASTSTASFNGSANVTPGVTGTLPVANGGTGQTTANAALNALLPAQSQSTTIGATLKSNGTNSYWDNFSASGTVQDQSGNFYNTIAIGTQVWFKENLRTKKYRSGALIPVKTNTDTSTIIGKMYYYNNDSLTNYSVYGALYNWKAIQGDTLCPTGWHVPTDAEWTTLTTYLGGESVAGGKMKSIGTIYWNSSNTGATNESGFSTLPGGYLYYDGNFYDINIYAFFWSATENGSSSAWTRYLIYSNGNLYRSDYNKSFGASVRCLKN